MPRKFRAPAQVKALLAAQRRRVAALTALVKGWLRRIDRAPAFDGLPIKRRTIYLALAAWQTQFSWSRRSSVLAYYTHWHASKV
jgi:hypothetical protein